MVDVLLDKVFFYPLRFNVTFLGETWRLYIFALNPTNSSGARDPVSLLNFPILEDFCWKTILAPVQSCWYQKKLQVSPHICIQVISFDSHTQRISIRKQSEHLSPYFRFMNS